MKSTPFLRATLVVAAAAAQSPCQMVRPESLSYMSRTFRLADLAVLDNPRYSRDGKWLAFDARNGPRGQHVFVVPAAGGTPIAITAGAHNEIRPMWTAAGDRLVFFSSDGNGALMTVGLNPATGRATGPAKRVTIDSLRSGAAVFDVAPDGRSVAYLTPKGGDKFDLRTSPINGGPARTLATIDGPAGGLRFDRDGNQIYYWVQHLDGTPVKGVRARDIRRIGMSGGAQTTVFTIPEGLMGLQIDPLAGRVLVRNGEHAHVLTLTGDSVATIVWGQGFRTVSNLGFTADGSSLVTALDASQSSIHVVPLDGGPVRVLTDGNDTPWPDVWIGESIFISDDDRGVQTLLALDGKKRTITFDLRKANDGVPVRVFSDDPFPDGVHYAVYAVDAAGDTSLFVYDSRTGDARRTAKKVTGSRMVVIAGATDQYVAAAGGEMLYGNVRNGVVEVHSVDVSGRDHVLHSFALPKQREEFAFAPGRMAHAYQRADTAFLDVTIGSGNSVHVLERPGAIVSDIVFKRDGSSLYASVGTGRGETARTRAGFFSTLDVPSLTLPPRWVELGKCWHPTWLPSGDGVLEFCQDSKGVRTRVERILASGPAGQTLTQRETMPFWDYTMSPDGKYVAVPAEKSAGISLWRIDLQAAAKRQAAP